MKMETGQVEKSANFEGIIVKFPQSLHIFLI